MKKTLYIFASLALSTLSVQAATLWTTTFGSAAQPDPTQVTLTNTGGEINGVLGSVTSLKKTANTGGAESDCSLKTVGGLGQNASLFTPDVNVQTNAGGAWNAGMTFTNTGSQGCSISSVKMTMIAFNVDGDAQPNNRTFSLTLNIGGQEKNVTLTIESGKASSGKDVTLTFDEPVELGAGQSLDFSVIARRTSETAGSFFGIKSMEFQGDLLVPEPATASLSLLGLAALMMRRRRA